MAKIDVIKLEIPSSPEFVSLARSVIEGISSCVGLGDGHLEDLKLAIGEACTNAVKFSGPGKPPVRVTYRIDPQRVEIEVRNTGAEFHEEKRCPRAPSIEQLPDGGLGIYLIDQVMDELTITSEGGETTLTMAKRLKP